MSGKLCACTRCWPAQPIAPQQLRFRLGSTCLPFTGSGAVTAYPISFVLAAEGESVTISTSSYPPTLTQAATQERSQLAAASVSQGKELQMYQLRPALTNCLCQWSIAVRIWLTNFKAQPPSAGGAHSSCLSAMH